MKENVVSQPTHPQKFDGVCEVLHPYRACVEATMTKALESIAERKPVPDGGTYAGCDDDEET